MKNIVNCAIKDLKLSFHASVIVYLILGFALFFAPNYPAYVGPFFIVVGIMLTFNMDLANRDREFCGIMPISKSDAVYGRVLAIAFLEIIEIAVCIPGAILGSKVLSSLVHVADVFIKPNLVLFSAVLLGYGFSNFLIIPAGYSKQFRVGGKTLASTLIYVLIIGVTECVSKKEVSGFLRENSAEALMKQIPILAVSIVVYIVLTLLAAKQAAKKFEMANI